MTKILIIEDDIYALNALVTYLQRAKYETAVAHSVTEGWERIQTWQPHIALIDGRIPLNNHSTADKKHGIELAEKIKQRYQHIKVIITSVLPDTANTAANLNAIYGNVAFADKANGVIQLKHILQKLNSGAYALPSHTLHQYNQDEIAAYLESQLTDVEQRLVAYARKIMPTLTKRELEVTQLLAQSYTADAIGQQLSLARGTIDNYLSAIYRKLGLNHNEGEQVRPSIIVVKTYQLYQLTNPNK